MRTADVVKYMKIKWLLCEIENAFKKNSTFYRTAKASVNYKEYLCRRGRVKILVRYAK